MTDRSTVVTSVIPTRDLAKVRLKTTSRAWSVLFASILSTSARPPFVATASAQSALTSTLSSNKTASYASRESGHLRVLFCWLASRLMMSSSNSCHRAMKTTSRFSGRTRSATSSLGSSARKFKLIRFKLEKKWTPETQAIFGAKPQLRWSLKVLTRSQS